MSLPNETIPATTSYTAYHPMDSSGDIDKKLVEIGIWHPLNTKGKSVEYLGAEEVREFGGGRTFVLNFKDISKNLEETGFYGPIFGWSPKSLWPLACAVNCFMGPEKLHQKSVYPEYVDGVLGLRLRPIEHSGISPWPNI